MGNNIEIQDFTQGVVTLLYRLYGTDCTYYRDTIPQNFKAPSFYVRCSSMDMELVRAPRYRCQMFIDITYFPKDTRQPSLELSRVLSEVFPLLEYIPIPGGMVRVKTMDSHMDDELHIELQIEYFMFKEIDRGALMQELRQFQSLKE